MAVEQAVEKKVEVWSMWEPEAGLISARLAGHVHVEDIMRWEAALQESLAQVPASSGFKLLIDLSGYELHDMAAHKMMRGIVPQLLAAHGMRPAVLDLFPEVIMPVTQTTGKICLAYANVHHDVDKMTEYERTLGRANQRFFTDASVARQWILALDNTVLNA